MRKLPIFIVFLMWSTACSKAPNLQATTASINAYIQAATTVPTSTLLPDDTLTPSLAPTLTPAHVVWKSIPIIPAGVSSHIVEVFQRGLARGRDPSRFSKIGDCQNITPYFLSAFDDPSKYRLGDQYAYLQPTIDHFSGSWSRLSLATHGGFNAATVLNSFWTLVPRPDACEKGETPAACEIRVNNPSFVVISMEEAWSGDLQKYDHYMRLLVEYVLSEDVVPILATRAELPDTQISINEIVAQIAYDYGVPLWNFGAATLVLPDYGLSSDGFHLSPGTVEGNYFFDDPARMELGWTWRNLTALQALDAVYHFLTIHP